ncbi:cation diffusion facilitator family transporter [Brevibacillus halotolerans]|uniref:cation diffusion facilitator family transporter n=1 Tax=Brevibacillus TaxID=55080 RepID=UPI00215C5901|nr:MULTISPECIES: cation diffusion facilitator family transporter [Brevibacillus]MCR8965020.1 cation diffusion facilitator family transporter [Brevibacillus laterosporus]MCZ0837175.1 cation diffusion facilitator family transporter [Brevibacillus halotolerans]
MGHHHDHSHGGHHHHGKGANKRALLISLFIITAFLIVEVIGGFLTNSLALLSDAGHMLSDSSALFLSLIAMFFATRKPSAKKTYGFYRFEILAALINGVMLVVISLVIIWEAYQRFFAPPEVASLSMMGIAFVGLLANIAAAFVLMRGDYKNNLNIRSAFLHVLGDLLGSVGAILAGLLMWKFNWYIADPIISVVVAVLIMLSAWRVTRDSVDVLMESTPASIDADQVSDALSKIKGVTSVHDLHIWTVTSGFDSLSCHLHVKDGLASYPILQEALHLLEHQFGITHSTIQIEDSSILHQELLCETGPQTSDKHEHNHSH